MSRMRLAAMEEGAAAVLDGLCPDTARPSAVLALAALFFFVRLAVTLTPLTSTLLEPGC